MMKKVFYTALAAVCAVSGVQAAVFDYAADFSIASDPNGAWTYGYSDTLSGPITLYSESGTSGNRIFWRTNISLGTPTSYKDTSTGDAGFHPGPAQFAVVRFTSPEAGIMSVNGFFGTGDIGEVDVYVRKGTTSLFEALNVFTTQNFAFTTDIAAGESLDFIVGNSGDFGFDSTPLGASLNLNPVPEPATMAGLGLGALALMRRRRAKK